MTVQSTNNRVDSVADGVQTVFTYDYLLIDESHMFVRFDDVEQPTGWTVTGVGEPTGGEVTFAVPPTNGVMVTLIRLVPLTQEIDYVEYDPFPAEVAEAGLDLSVMRAQQQSEQSVRSPIFTLADVPAGGVTLQSPEAFKAIGYDADGNLSNLEVGGGGELVVNPMSSNLDGGGLDITNVNNIEADGGTIATLQSTTITTTTLDAATTITKGGEAVLNQSELDAAYDALGSAAAAQAAVQGNLDAHTGDVDIHYSDAPNDGTQYVRKDLGWEEVEVPPGTTVSPTPPPAPLVGQVWLNSDTGRQFIWYIDSDGGQWIENGPGVVTETYVANGSWEFVASKELDTDALVVLHHDGIDGTPTDFIADYEYYIGLHNVVSSTDAGSLLLWNSYEGSAYATGTSDYVDQQTVLEQLPSDAVLGNTVATASPSYGYFSWRGGNTAIRGITGGALITSAASTARHTSIQWSSSGNSTTYAHNMATGFSKRNGSAATKYIKAYLSQSVTMVSGRITLLRRKVA